MVNPLGKNRTIRRVFVIGALLLLCAGMLLGAALAGGATVTMSDDYGISISAVLGQHEDCEEGYVWQPSVTNPIAGECVPE